MRRRSSGPSARRAAIVGCLVGALVAGAARAEETTLMTETEVPEHLAAGGQYFEATPYGLQAYLNTIKTTRPELFAQLAPDADRLARRTTTAITLVIAGLGAGVASTIYGIASRTSCVSPPVTDPHFAADSAAWSDCDQHNLTHMTTFGVIGAGLAVAGMVGALVVVPSRRDLLEVVNKHNRLSPQPLQLQLGYDPIQRLASAGAALSF